MAGGLPDLFVRGALCLTGTLPIPESGRILRLAKPK